MFDFIILQVLQDLVHKITCWLLVATALISGTRSFTYKINLCSTFVFRMAFVSFIFNRWTFVTVARCSNKGNV